MLIFLFFQIPKIDFRGDTKKTTVQSNFDELIVTSDEVKSKATILEKADNDCSTGGIKDKIDFCGDTKKTTVESNFDEIIVSSDEVKLMIGDGPRPIKRKQEVDPGDDTTYHAMLGVNMPKFLNGPPRIGLSKSKVYKSLHKKPKFVNN